MAVRGVYLSHSAIAGDRANDFASRLLVAQFGGMVPLTALSAGTPRDSITNTSWSWREDSHISGNTTCPAGAGSGATTFTVADPNIWIPGSIILNQATGEQIFVVSMINAAVTVVRGFAGTVPAAITNVQRLQLISTAFPEASRGADAVVSNGESRTSYVQIFKRAFEVSGTAQAVKFNTGSKLAANREEAKNFLMEDLERAALFQRPSVSVVTTADGPKEMRTTMGLDYAIRNFGGNVVIPAANGVAGRLNLKILNDFIRAIFDRNIKAQPNERITFCGSSILGLIQEMVLDLKGYRYQVNENAFGIKVTELVTPTGTLKLSTHPLFVENADWQQQLWVMHPGGMRRKELRALSVVEQDNRVQNNGMDSTKGHLMMEMGYEFGGTKTMGMLVGAATAGGLAALPVA